MAKEIMKKKVEKFNPTEYEPKELIKTHWNEAAEWDTEFEILYKELKYDLRKKQTPIRKKYLISGSKIKKWFEKLSEYCTIATSYFPKSFSVYAPYLLMVETDYEDFIVELFSELPTSSFFFKVSDKLFLYIFVNRYFLLGNAEIHTSELNRLFLRLLLKNLSRKGIIKSESHARPECYRQKDF